MPGAPDPGARRNGHGHEPSGSLLHVLIAGEPPSDPSSLLASKALAALLTELRERAETIVIDTPPVLPVADTMGLTSQADAYMVVSKLDLVRRPMLHELRRELGTARALGLGVVVTDAESESGYGYGGGIRLRRIRRSRRSGGPDARRSMIGARAGAHGRVLTRAPSWAPSCTSATSRAPRGS